MNIGQSKGPAERIGNMNGRWMAGFKLLIVAFPALLSAILGWAIYITSQVQANSYFRKDFPHATTKSIDNQIDRRIGITNSRLDRIEEKLDRLIERGA